MNCLFVCLYSGINSAIATPQNMIWNRKNPTTKMICPCWLILVASAIVSTGSPPYIVVWLIQ